MYRRYEENANNENKNVEFWWEATKFETLFFSELHLKTMHGFLRVETVSWLGT